MYYVTKHNKNSHSQNRFRISYNSIYPKSGGQIIIMPTKSLIELWHEAIYMAHVNFLNKHNLFDEWKKFKAGKKLKQDDYKLMSQFIEQINKNNNQE